MDRSTLVTELVEYKRGIEDILKELSSYGWDCDAPLVRLLPEHMVNVLDRYCRGELSAAQVDAWANAIECRDDIGYDPKSICGEVLHELGNREITGELSIDRAVARMALFGPDRGARF